MKIGHADIVLEGVEKLVKSQTKGTKPRGRKTNRIYIVGTEQRWQVDPDEGTAFYQRKKVTPDGNVQPLIDLGPNVACPVIPAYDDGSRHRFLDEIIAWHCHRQLNIVQQKHAHMIHRDGDWSNCAADNVEQVIDPDWLYQNDMRQLLRSNIPPAGNCMGYIKGLSATMPYAPYHGGLSPRDLREDLRGDDTESNVIRLPEHHVLPVPDWVIDRRKAEQDRLKAS